MAKIKIPIPVTKPPRCPACTRKPNYTYTPHRCEHTEEEYAQSDVWLDFQLRLPKKASYTTRELVEALMLEAWNLTYGFKHTEFQPVLKQTKWRPGTPVHGGANRTFYGTPSCEFRLAIRPETRTTLKGRK